MKKGKQSKKGIGFFQNLTWKRSKRGDKKTNISMLFELEIGNRDILKYIGDMTKKGRLGKI